MKCLMCKQAEPRPGHTTVNFTRGDFGLVLKDVPALICPLCGETYTDEATTGQLLELAYQMEEMGVKMEIRSFDEANG